VIRAGHRLRVTVASSAFPKYDRNLNIGGDNERDTRYIVVKQRILHDRAHPSFVRLNWATISVAFGRSVGVAPTIRFHTLDVMSRSLISHS